MMAGKKHGALASALRNSGATVAAQLPEEEMDAPMPDTAAPSTQSSRLSTKAITVHFPEGVRRQLKTMAAEQGRNMEDMVAEALNLLFTKYRKAELAPRKIAK